MPDIIPVDAVPEMVQAKLTAIATRLQQEMDIANNIIDSISSLHGRVSQIEDDAETAGASEQMLSAIALLKSKASDLLTAIQTHG